MKLIFFHADKHEIFIKIDTIVLMGIVKLCQSSQNSKFAMSLQYLKEEVGVKVYVLHVDKHQSLLQVDFNTLGITMSYKVILPLLLGMISILKVLKVIILQYLYNISKTKLGMEFISLHAVKHQRFYKLGLLFLMEVARYVQSTQNRNLVIFLQHIKKRVLQLLLCSIVMQNNQIFYWGPVRFIVTCFLAQSDCIKFLPEH